MKNTEKYTRQFFPPPIAEPRWVKKSYVEHAPAWCSVDLRDGNQALPVPMDQPEKLELFRMLCNTGFKEIEVGFPAASDTEYLFVRELIERNLIPADVTVQVMTQARESIVRRTFASLSGVKHAIVHLYCSTSPAQREQVYDRSKEEVLEMAVRAARLMQQLQDEAGTDYQFEFTPESFSATEPDYALGVAEAVLAEWKLSPRHKAILNLPSSVELSMPHVYADMIEYIGDRLSCRDSVTLSLHAHNDRGSAVSACEMGLLAGAERVEGTLFGGGERSGNVDLVTLALNLYTQGIDPQLDFSDLPRLSAAYERLTRTSIPERQPYSGSMVFASFSGSHQDAITKGLRYHESAGGIWSVPYLAIDPADIGRGGEDDIIRINSQSGKGGIGYILQHRFGFNLPERMRSIASAEIKSFSDTRHRPMTPEDVYHAFSAAFININAPLRFLDYTFTRGEDKTTRANVKFELGGVIREMQGEGRGRLDAIVSILRDGLGLPFSHATYSEHALESATHEGTTCAEAVTYVSVVLFDGSESWGIGLDDDIVASSVHALVSALNRSPALFNGLV